MALKFCLNADKTGEITDVSPLTTAHNGTTGQTVEVKVYLYNNDVTKRYESITVTPKDTADTSEAAWIALAPDNAGSPGVYVTAGAALTMANITDTAVKPFWVKVAVPALTPSQNKADLRLEALALEFAV